MHESLKNPNVTPPVILFATPPPLETLRALTVRVDSSGLTGMPAMKFQPQVIKCREFIFTEPEVIGTPSFEPKDQCFHLVAQLSLLQSGKLQTRLSRVGLQVTKPYPVTPELYQSCLRYTLMARISPNWNKAGEWLVQGRDFLSHTGAVNAVKLDLSVNCNELFFTLEATALKLAPLKVTDLDILGNSMEKFLKRHVYQIDHDSIASDWCFVLPSMKRGKIVSISYDIPEESPFMSYRDLKRFWKNTYGYRLPESDEEMIYYQIHFGPLGGRLFTYPEVCLRGRELQRVPRVDPKPILRDFMKEITTKFPTICGAPMKLQSKAKFPLADLFESGQKDPQCQPNLTNKMSARPSAYRSKDEMERLLTSKPDFINSQMCSNSHKANMPSSDITHQTTSDLPVRKYGVSCVSRENKSATPDTARQYISGSNNKQVKPVNTTLSQKKTGVTPSYKAVTTTSSSLPPKSHAPVINSSLSYTTNSEQSPQISSAFSSSASINKNFVPNSQTPNQCHSETGHSGNMVSPSSVSRRLFPQFIPKKTLPQVTSTPNNQAPKHVPTFCVQKRPSIALPVTEKSVSAPLASTSIVSSSTSIVCSQNVQQPGRKIPLFFRKSIAEKMALVEKQKSAGLKKTKSGSGKKDVKEKGVKSVKRSSKKDGESEKKKLKQAEQ